MSKKSISGIYAIKNKTNNKIYIGSSKSVYYRWKQQHKPELIKNKHYNKYLQNAWNKYGEMEFEFKVIEECKESMLDEREGHWIEFYKSWDRKYGYNLRRFINGRTVLHEETIEKMRQNKKQEWQRIKENNYEGVNLGFIKYKLTPEKKEEIEKLREEGLPYEEIFKITGISKTHYYRALDFQDGQYCGTRKRKTYKTMTPEVKEKAIELRNQGKTWKQIGEILGVDRTLFYRHNLAKDQPNMVRKSMNKETIKLIVKLRNEGKKWREISEITNFPESTCALYYENKKDKR